MTTNLDQLSADAIDSTPQSIDWQEALGEDAEGWRYYEAIDCDECGRTVVTSFGGEEHRYLEDPFVLAKLPEDGSQFSCPECCKTFTVKLMKDDDEDTAFACPHCSILYYVGDDYANNCRGTITAEGPMMNYWYPVDIRDPEEAALAIAIFPLCVVEFEDGRTGLALTGGGMDFSWEVCAAFVALGKLPPTHFCNLPDMAGQHRVSWWRDVVQACKRSLEVQSSWLADRLGRLSNLEAKLDKASQEDAA